MIYQMQIYYGALLNGKAIYSLESSLYDCKKFPKGINQNTFKIQIQQAIVQDGLNPMDFEIGYLTKEQYDNRFSKETERSNTWIIEK